MFDDEMTEEHMTRTAEEYYSVTLAEKHEERLACARAYIVALEGQIAMLKHRAHVSDRAFATR